MEPSKPSKKSKSKYAAAFEQFGGKQEEAEVQANLTGFYGAISKLEQLKSKKKAQHQAQTLAQPQQRPGTSTSGATSPKQGVNKECPGASTSDARSIDHERSRTPTPAAASAKQGVDKEHLGAHTSGTNFPINGNEFDDLEWLPCTPTKTASLSQSDKYYVEAQISDMSGIEQLQDAAFPPPEGSPTGFSEKPDLDLNMLAYEGIIDKESLSEGGMSLSKESTKKNKPSKRVINRTIPDFPPRFYEALEEGKRSREAYLDDTFGPEKPHGRPPGRGEPSDLSSQSNSYKSPYEAWDGKETQQPSRRTQEEGHQFGFETPKPDDVSNQFTRDFNAATPETSSFSHFLKDGSDDSRNNDNDNDNDSPDVEFDLPAAFNDANTSPTDFNYEDSAAPSSSTAPELYWDEDAPSIRVDHESGDVFKYTGTDAGTGRWRYERLSVAQGGWVPVEKAEEEKKKTREAGEREGLGGRGRLTGRYAFLVCSCIWMCCECVHSFL